MYPLRTLIRFLPAYRDYEDWGMGHIFPRAWFSRRCCSRSGSTPGWSSRVRSGASSDSDGLRNTSHRLSSCKARPRCAASCDCGRDTALWTSYRRLCSWKVSPRCGLGCDVLTETSQRTVFRRSDTCVYVGLYRLHGDRCYLRPGERPCGSSCVSEDCPSEKNSSHRLSSWKVSHWCELKGDGLNLTFGKMFFHRMYSCKAWVQSGSSCVDPCFLSEQTSSHRLSSCKVCPWCGLSCGAGAWT